MASNLIVIPLWYFSHFNLGSSFRRTWACGLLLVSLHRDEVRLKLKGQLNDRANDHLSVEISHDSRISSHTYQHVNQAHDFYTNKETHLISKPGRCTHAPRRLLHAPAPACDFSRDVSIMCQIFERCSWRHDANGARHSYY